MQNSHKVSFFSVATYILSSSTNLLKNIQLEYTLFILNFYLWFIFQTIQGDPDYESEEVEMESPTKRSRAVKKEDSTRSKTGKTPNKTAKSVKKEEETPVRRGRGRPKKSGDSFPYSEIKEIIEASKKTDTGKRGRGRPPKKLPAPAVVRSTKGKEKSKAGEDEVDKTPTSRSGRYGTRGIKRNYLEMSSGKVEIKQEVVSDEDAEESDEDLVQSEEEVVESTPRTRRRGRPPKRAASSNDDSVEEEPAPDDDDYLDDNEQESQELNDEDAEDDLDGSKESESLDGSPVKKIVVLSPSKPAEDQVEVTPGSKITDSMVKSLRTSKVSTSVPAIAKVGIRTVKVGKRKAVEDEDEILEKELEKAVEVANLNSLHCSLCDDHKAENFSDLTAHLKIFHHVYEPPRCDICEVDFDTLKRLELHIERKHGPKSEPEKFLCQYEGCGKVFTSQVGLTGHVNRGHLGQPTSTAEKKYTCDTCGYKTNSREDLWEHKKVDHGEQIECKPCNRIFINFNTLKAHNDLKHAEDGQQICNVCGKEFTSKMSLQNHMKLHNQKLFTCEICNKSMSTKTSFNNHMERHKPEKDRKYRFYCAFCGKGFSVKSNFDDHQNKHTGNKPYKCNLCPKTFGFRSMMKKHKTFVHSSERPFKCGFCLKGFKYMNLLKNHVTIHTNKSKHVCTYCNKVFSTASTLKLHVKKCGSITASTSQATNTIIMYSDSSLIDGAGNLADQQVIVGNTSNVVMDSTVLQSADGLSNIVVSDPTSILQADNVGISEPIDNNVLAANAAPTEVEVYACSECNSTFASFQEAEAHVLTAHSVVTQQ